MAILRNFTANILVNGQALQEYEGDGEMENENPDMVVKYIQATSNARFTINISVRDMSRSTADGVTFCLSLDGTYVDSTILTSVDPKQDLWGEESNWNGIDSVSSRGGWELIPFMFSEIKTVEALTSLDFNNPSILNEIGTITIKIYRGNVTSCESRPKPWETIKLGKLTEVAENKLKGLPLTHVSMLGEPMKGEPFHEITCDYLDNLESPHATFIFKHCSKKALQNMLLISRSPSPLPLEERPVEELSLEQLQEIVRQQQARAKVSNPTVNRLKNDASIDSIKRERYPETKEILNSASVKKVKVEQPVAHREIVELSDDD